MGCIYMHINKVNFKKYVGQTVHDWKDRNRRFGDEGCRYGDTFFGGAVKKYGWDNFYHICLLDNVDKDDLDYYEQMYIRIYDTYENGYNFTEGGQHISDRDYTYSKIANSRMGENHPLYGKKLSEETREKMSRARTGKHHSEEWKENISNARKGLVFSEEHKKRLSESHKGKHYARDNRKHIVCLDMNNNLIEMNKDIEVLSNNLKIDVEDIRSFLSVNNDKDNIKGYRFLYRNYYNKMIQEGKSYYEVREDYNNTMSNAIKGIKRSDDTKKKIADAKISRAKYVVAKRLSDGVEYVFHSGREIERILGINNAVVYKILRGKTRTDVYRGYSYRFATEEEKKLYDPNLLETIKIRIE